MNRTRISFPVTDFTKTKYQILNWSRRFRICSILDGHQYDPVPGSFEILGAFGAAYSVKAEAGQAFKAIREFAELHNDWIFGHFGFDLKNETELNCPSKQNGIEFDDLYFFVPEILIRLYRNQLIIECLGIDPIQVRGEMERSACKLPLPDKRIPEIQSRFTREEYIDTVEALRNHILRGDCYEINFCQEFFCRSAVSDPLALYDALSKKSPMPFGAYYRIEDQYLLCASPERYLKKQGDILESQPIKGTWPRDNTQPGMDDEGRRMLFESAKDRSENIMVVDLVRNDLSKICVPGTVRVEELFGIYSFPQLHQMISTIQGRMRKELHWTEAIRQTFPMGSMTGAPKQKVLELIGRYEKTKRGLFSGAIGYVKPSGDFDFNVVIRSIFYNGTRQYISYLAGSGITFNSDAANEYEECLLKAEAIKKVLAG